MTKMESMTIYIVQYCGWYPVVYRNNWEVICCIKKPHGIVPCKQSESLIASLFTGWFWQLMISSLSCMQSSFISLCALSRKEQVWKIAPSMNCIQQIIIYSSLISLSLIKHEKSPCVATTCCISVGKYRLWLVHIVINKKEVVLVCFCIARLFL